jgi:hypothetical protein
MTRTSIGNSLLAPSRRILCSSRTRSSLAGISGRISVISSRRRGSPVRPLEAAFTTAIRASEGAAFVAE